MSRFTPARIAEIRGHLASIERGDRTVAEVARELGVAAWTIYSWKRRFAAGRSGRKRSVRAVDHKAELIEIEQPSASELIEIVIGPMTIRVPRAFDPIELQRVLGVARAC